MDRSLLIVAALHACGWTHRDFFLQERTHPACSWNTLWDTVRTRDHLTTPWIPDARRSLIEEKIRTYDLDCLEETIQTLWITLLQKNNPLFPNRLTHLVRCPYILYLRWTLPQEDMLMLGIVGSRQHTQYGKYTLEMLFRDFPKWSLSIISGGAYWIDTLAHTLALDNHIHTVSVFGSGIDMPYPQKNRPLFQKIEESGWALLSIFPLWSKAEPYMFPVRNEIVAALSDGILIPEAAEKSGTLITAALALEQGKEVFAIPGDLSRNTSRGCNLLIAKWEAKCILQTRDILEEFFSPDDNTSPISSPATVSIASEIGKSIYTAIGDGYTSPEALSQHLHLNSNTLMMELALLEIDGYIQLGADGNYAYIYHS